MSDSNETQTPPPAAARVAAVATAIAKREFKWAARGEAGTVSLVRAGESSPVFIQMNN